MLILSYFLRRSNYGKLKTSSLQELHHTLTLMETIHHQSTQEAIEVGRIARTTGTKAH